MLALIIIGCILAFLALLLLLPVGFRADYDAQGLRLRLKVACFRFLLYPGREKPKKEKKRKEKRAKGDTAQPSQEEQGDKGKKPGDLKWLLELIQPGLVALGKLRRKLKITLMRVDYSIGGASDPADAAIRYGIISAGGGVLFPLLNTAFDVRHWDVNVGVDFQREQSLVILAAEGGWRLGTLVRILLTLGLCAFQAYRKQQNQKEIKTTTTKEDIHNGRKASDR